MDYLGPGYENSIQGSKKTVGTTDSLCAPPDTPTPAVCRSQRLATGRTETLHPSLRGPHRSTRMGQPTSSQCKSLSLPRSESRLAEGKTTSYTSSYGGHSHPHHAGPSLPPALHHLLLPQPRDLGRKVEEEAPWRGGSRPIPSSCKVPINLKEKALGINFPFITYFVIQATVLPGDILDESATGYAHRMMDYGAGGGKTPCKKSTEK